MAPPAWGNSPAKQLFTQLYKDKESWLHLCLLEQIHDSEPLFKQYEWGKFRANANRLMTKLDLEEECIAHDKLGLERYKKNNPRPEKTFSGDPFWDTHAAKALLKDLVAKQDQSLKNKTIQRKLLPAEARMKHTAFLEFSLYAFRNHYYREMRSLIEEVFWQKKRNREGQRRQEREEQQQE